MIQFRLRSSPLGQSSITAWSVWCSIGITPKLNFDIAVDYQKEDQNAFNGSSARFRGPLKRTKS